MNKVAFGKVGEARVSKILPGSKHVNASKQSVLPYDILWNNIKIDVKHTENVADGVAVFAIKKGSIRHNGIIVVCTAIIDGEECFWVDQYRNGVVSARKKLAAAITAKDLPKAIIAESIRLVDPIKIDAPVNFKSITISSDVFSETETLRKELIKTWKDEQHVDMKISLADAVRISVKSYRKNRILEGVNQDGKS